MNRTYWRIVRTGIRFAIYACCLGVVLLTMLVFVSSLLNPFAGFAGSEEFFNKSGPDAKRRMSEWPMAIDPAKVKTVSRKFDFSIDSHSVWFKIELDATSARIWADHVHTDKERRTRESISPDDRGLEGVRRELLGPPPLHHKTGYVPAWWNPPTIQFRATEAMKWYSGFDSGVGQAAYTGYDVGNQTLWVYEYACQHDRLWEQNQIPEGDVYSRIKQGEPGD